MTVEPYQIVGTLGQGAHGDIHLVESIRGDKFALKSIRTGHDKQIKHRANNEIETLKSLDGASGRVVQYIDSFERDDHIHIVMGFIDGCDVWDWVNEQEDISEHDVETFLGFMLETLSTLEQKNIIHRDISMSNLLLPLGDITRPVLIDFGLSWKHGYKHITNDAMSMGTLDCSSPEHLKPSTITHQSDLYSLGMICYWMCTGLHGMSKHDSLQTFHQNLQDPNHQLFVELSNKALESTINSMLVKDIDGRATSATKLISKPRHTTIVVCIALVLVCIAGLAWQASYEPPVVGNKISVSSTTQKDKITNTLSMNNSIEKIKTSTHSDTIASTKLDAANVAHHILRQSMTIQKPSNKWKPRQPEVFDGSSPL